ncbi:MAG: hypothetical protein OXG24_03015 [Gammaproteobacteria bacterium]|nr:hypothetical protein [Gammaproteobacteria bacterium]
MNFAKTQTWFYVLPTHTILGGIGLTCAVFWLFLDRGQSDSVDRPHDVITPSGWANSKQSQTSTWNTLNPASGNFSYIEQIQSPFDRDLILRDLVVATDE